MKKMLIKLFVLAELFFFSMLLRALDFPAPSEIFQKSLSINSEKYPDADQVLASDTQNIKYSSDGKAEDIDDVYIKILNEKGRRENLSLSFYFNTNYQQTEILILEIIKNDGKIIPIDIAANSKIAVSHHQISANIFDPDMKVLTVNVPRLEIGDLLHFRYLEKTLKQRMQNTWSTYIVFQGHYPVLDYRVEILAPDELPIAKFAIKDEIKGTVEFKKEKNGSETIYTWTAKDVPQIFPEPDMPEMYLVSQRLLVSTIPRWEDISSWYWKISLPHLEKTTPQMQEKVSTLCSTAKNDDEKIRALFDFVSQKIRYMGITTETESPGYEPHDVSTTFENRYGVCRDKAALLAAMLRLAGFKAFPILIMAGPKKDEEVPNPYFNHAITCVEKDDGSYILMDATSEINKEILPSYLCDKSYLAAKPQGDTLRISPIIPASQNMISINTDAVLQANGELSAETTLSLTGLNDTIYRGALMGRSPDEITDFIEGLTRKIFPTVLKPKSYEISPKNLADTSLPLSIKIAYTVPDAIIKGEALDALSIPSFGTRIGVINFLTDKTWLKKRLFPLCTEIACGYSEKTTVKIKDKSALFSSIELPKNDIYEDDSMKWSQKGREDADGFSVESDFILKAVEFPPNEYIALKNAIGVRDRLSKCPILLEKKNTVAADNAAKTDNDGLALMSDELEFEINGKNSWTSTRIVEEKLNSFQGKREAAEIKIPYNQEMDEVKLEFAEVISPEGKKKLISADEINIMDEAWTASAPRYPAGKTLIASLPGVDIGSVIKYKIAIKTSKRPFFSFIESLNPVNATLVKKIKILNPQQISLRILESKNGKITTRLSKDPLIEWTFENLPKMSRESNLAPFWAVSDFVAVSAGDWDSYADNINESLLKAAGSKLAHGILSSLFNGKNLSAKEKCVLIRDYAAKNIKNAGPKFCDLPENFITSADETISSGYGNSADKAAALSALLSAAGIKNNFIMASSYSYLPPIFDPIQDCPQNGFFDSILVRADLGNKNVVLNDCDQYAELGTILHDGKTAFDLPSGGFFKISASPELIKASSSDIFIKIENNGDALIKKVDNFYGEKYALMKKQIEEMTPENLRRFYEQHAFALSPSASIEAPPVKDFSLYPGKIEMIIRITDFANFAENKIYFSVPAPLRVFENLQLTRENPYFSDAGGRIEMRFIVAPPAGYEKLEIIPEKEENYSFSPELFFSISSNTAKDCEDEKDFFAGHNFFVLIEQELVLSPNIFEKESYKKLLLESAEFNSGKSSTIVIKK